jgi:hypothetical protein
MMSIEERLSIKADHDQIDVGPKRGLVQTASD